MWLSKDRYEQLVARAARAEQTEGLAAKLADAESLLFTERRENRRAERHWASMFLRREKSYPLPPTVEEKEEKKAEQEAKRSEPPKLNEDQVARREAVRQWAKTQGLSQEDADKAFMSQLASQVDTD